jgi:serine/threonine protein kinase
MPDAEGKERMARDEAALRGPRRSRSYVGQNIGEKYQVIRLIGEGGMGAVYEVKHLVIGRRFAIKFLHWQIAHSDSTVARFKREAESAGRLENEHVVAVVDVGTTDEGAPYLVMEYLQGESLGTLLARCGPLPVARAVHLVLQVCRGLRAAHSHGMIHRDLKPENLFVVRDGDGGDLVKILDFGIVKLTAESPEAITDSGLMLGTPYYMSPEQARGDHQVDARTDIYAVGVVLYELLTARKPHPGSNATSVLFHLLKQEPVRIEALRSGLPAGLGDLIHRAFAFDAAERFPDVAALWDALSGFSATGVDEDFPTHAGTSLGESSETLARTELPLSGPGGDEIHPSANTEMSRVAAERFSVGNRRVMGGVVALALLVVGSFLSWRARVARRPESAFPSFSSAAALGDGDRDTTPEEKPFPPVVSPGVSDRAAGRPLGWLSADASAPASDARSGGSSLPARNKKPSTNRASVRPPPADSAARQLLREHLYEP